MAVRTKYSEDSFNRADENPLFGLWGLHAGSLKVVSNACQAVGLNDYKVMTMATILPDRQYAAATVATVGGTGSIMGVGLRVPAPPTHSGYYLFIGSSPSLTRLFRVDAGVLTQIGTNNTAITWVVGDVASIEADGTAIACFRNGVAISGCSGTDATFASGRAGLLLNVESAGPENLITWDNFESGGLTDAAIDFGSKTARSIVATDLFDRADNLDLGASWDVYTGASALRILTNRVRVGTANAENLESWNADALANDQYCKLVIPTLTVNDFVMVGVRGASPATRTCYLLLVRPNGFAEIRKETAGVIGAPMAARHDPWVSGDTAVLEADGTSLRAYRGSTKIMQVQNSDLTAGRPVIGINVSAAGEANIEIDSFEAGTLSVPAAGPPSVATQKRTAIRVGDFVIVTQ